jgi:WD40 repeat protein
VRLWNAETGVCTHILQGHTGPLVSVDWNADGSVLASGSSNGNIRIWDVQKGASRVSIEGVGQISAVVWSPDGKLLACATEERRVQIFRATDGDLLQQFEHTGTVYTLCWSPDGEQVVSGSGDGEQGVLSIWDVRGGTLLRTFKGHSGFVTDVDWSADHHLLVSVGTHGTLRWWDVEQGVSLATMQAHQAWARAVRISPDGETVASCGEDGEIGLWDLHSYQLLITLRADRPYERMDISGTLGLTRAQRAALHALGAVDAEEVMPPRW